MPRCSRREQEITSPNSSRSDPHAAAQVSAAWAAADAANRANELSAALSAQDLAFSAAMRETQAVRDFVGSPGSILGSATTKHGEIAEQVTVGFTRASDFLHGRAASATFEGVGRLAPTDYRVDGVDIQSKYYNGIRNTLGGTLDHANKHPDFSGRYHIPKDQFEQLDQLRQTGQIDGLSEKSANAVRSEFDALQRQTGRSADDLIGPGEGRYDEVQQGRVHDTIRNREEKLAQENEAQKQAARADNAPSLSGLGKAAGLGAAAGGGFALAQAIWSKHREGKNLFRGDYTAQDWQDIGLTTAKGAGGGAVAGGALYLVTNSTALAAPFAGSLVSGLMGVGELLRQYHAGAINGAQFAEMSHIVAADAAIVGLATMAGQALIPLPILGALVGALAGPFVASAIKNGLGKSESELIARLADYEKRALRQLDAEYRALIQRLDTYFGNLERLAEVAFDHTVNTQLRLSASVEFAEAAGVPDNRILRTAKDLDAFMTE